MTGFGPIGVAPIDGFKTRYTQQNTASYTGNVTVVDLAKAASITHTAGIFFAQALFLVRKAITHTVGLSSATAIALVQKQVGKFVQAFVTAISLIQRLLTLSRIVQVFATAIALIQKQIGKFVQAFVTAKTFIQQRQVGKIIQAFVTVISLGKAASITHTVGTFFVNAVFLPLKAIAHTVGLSKANAVFLGSKNAITHTIQFFVNAVFSPIRQSTRTLTAFVTAIVLRTKQANRTGSFFVNAVSSTLRQNSRTITFNLTAVFLSSINAITHAITQFVGATFSVVRTFTHSNAFFLSAIALRVRQVNRSVSAFVTATLSSTRSLGKFISFFATVILTEIKADFHALSAFVTATSLLAETLVHQLLRTTFAGAIAQLTNRQILKNLLAFVSATYSIPLKAITHTVGTFFVTAIPTTVKAITHAIGLFVATIKSQLTKQSTRTMTAFVNAIALLTNRQNVRNIFAFAGLNFQVMRAMTKTPLTAFVTMVVNKSASFIKIFRAFGTASFTNIARSIVKTVKFFMIVPLFYGRQFTRSSSYFVTANALTVSTQLVHLFTVAWKATVIALKSPPKIFKIVQTFITATIPPILTAFPKTPIQFTINLLYFPGALRHFSVSWNMIAQFFPDFITQFPQINVSTFTTFSAQTIKMTLKMFNPFVSATSTISRQVQNIRQMLLNVLGNTTNQSNKLFIQNVVAGALYQNTVMPIRNAVVNASLSTTRNVRKLVFAFVSVGALLQKTVERIVSFFTNAITTNSIQKARIYNTTISTVMQMSRIVSRLIKVVVTVINQTIRSPNKMMTMFAQTIQVMRGGKLVQKNVPNFSSNVIALTMNQGVKPVFVFVLTNAQPFFTVGHMLAAFVKTVAQQAIKSKTYTAILFVTAVARKALLTLIRTGLAFVKTIQTNATLSLRTIIAYMNLAIPSIISRLKTLIAHINLFK